MKRLSPKEFSSHFAKSFSSLIACLFGLETGKPKRDVIKITSGGYLDIQSQYLAVAAASELLCRCTVRYPLFLQRMLLDEMESQQVSKVFRDILSAFRLAPCRKYADIKACEEVVEKLMGGASIGGWDMPILNGDNIGWKRRGAECGYESAVVSRTSLCGNSN